MALRSDRENAPVSPRRGWLISAGLCLLSLSLSGCGKDPPPPPPPTIVNLKLSATGTANAMTDGRGAPVLVRVYQLGSKAAFEREDFFRIYKEDAAALGADLLKKDEFLLIPGTAKTISLSPGPTVKALGVFAAYRDFQAVKWRVDTDIPPNQTTNLTLTADRPGVALSPSGGKPAGP